MTLPDQTYTSTALSIVFNKFSMINYPTSPKSSSYYTIPKSTMKLTNFLNFKKRYNPLKYIYRYKTKRNKISTTMQSKGQRKTSLT